MFIITHERGYTKIIASGKLKHADYIKHLVPTIEKLAKDSDFRVMVILNDMQGIELKAILDDLKFYIKNRRKFDKIAIVTTKKWIKISLGFFRHIISGEFKTFSKVDIAEKWITK